MIEHALQEPWVLLLFAVGLLAMGPLLFAGVGRFRWLRPVLDGFVLVGVGGFVLVHVLPDTMEQIGAWAIPMALLGLFVPMVLGRFLRVPEEQTHTHTMWLVWFGLALHAMIDGMALALPSKASGHAHAGSALAMAVLMHRLPVSLLVWGWGRRSLGIQRASGMLLMLAVATAFGFALGGQVNLTALGSGWPYALFQALVAGALLHVLLHKHDDHDHGTSPIHQWKWGEVGGALLGVGLLLAFPSALGHIDEIGHTAHHAHGMSHFGPAFLHLALESAPALLLGYLMAGLLSSFLPQASLLWLHRGGSFQQASKGALFGLPLPICSCGVVPVYQSLVQRGVPATAGLAFLIATPELGVESIVLSFPLLGGSLTAVRLMSALILALLIGWIVGRTVTQEAVPPAPSTGSETKEPFWERLVRAGRVGLGTVVSDTAAWILVGLVIAALLQPASVRPLLAQLPQGADVFLFATLGIPFYVCASGATPLAAALIFSGVSPGAAVAFLLAGPATNVTTFGVLTQLHGVRTAIFFGVAMLVGAIGLGMTTNVLLPGYKVPFASTAHHHDSPLQWICLGILCLAFSIAILRQGPTAFVWSIFTFGRHHDHDHSHGHNHDHSHEHSHEHSHDHAQEKEQKVESSGGCGSCCGSIIE